jgi:hypothetical protein
MPEDGGDTVDPVAVDWNARLSHIVVTVHHAVFNTLVSAHTSPTFPVIVKVYAAEFQPMFRPVLLHTNRVPVPMIEVIVGGPNPAGSAVPAPTITGDIVSTKVRLSTVDAPMFVTTIWYVTSSPTPGFAGVCDFTIVTVVVGG